MKYRSSRMRQFLSDAATSLRPAHSRALAAQGVSPGCEAVTGRPVQRVHCVHSQDLLIRGQAVALLFSITSMCSRTVGLQLQQELCCCTRERQHGLAHNSLEHLLLHQLGAAIGAAGMQRAVLCEGHLFRHAVHRAAAAEHNLRDAARQQARCRAQARAPAPDTGARVSKDTTSGGGMVSDDPQQPAAASLSNRQ